MRWAPRSWAEAARYLLALSRLALRPEENSLAWPARTFLPTGGHLIRRIQMLKENVQGPDRSFVEVNAHRHDGDAARRSAMVVVAFRGPAPAQGVGNTACRPDRQMNRNGNRFDLSFMSPSPWEFTRFGLRPSADSGSQVASSIRSATRSRKELPIGLPRLESIDQAAVEFKLLPRDQSKKLPGRIMTGDWMVRTVKDFDWKAAIKKLVKAEDKTPGELVEVRIRETGRTTRRPVPRCWDRTRAFTFPTGERRV